MNSIVSRYSLLAQRRVTYRYIPFARAVVSFESILPADSLSHCLIRSRRRSRRTSALRHSHWSLAVDAGRSPREYRFRNRHHSLGLLIFFDQTRLQPWIYQYLLLLGALALQSEQTKDVPSTNHTQGQLQIVVAALYIWSGVQKLNFSFSHEVLPKLLAPLQSVLSAVHIPLVATGIGMALIETLIGCGLLFRRTRELCVWLAVAMHGLILGLLMFRGYNSVVWPWNAALALIVVALFRRSKTAPWQTLRNWSAINTTTRLAQAVVIASALAPVLSFWGWWDLCLSGALYSGNTAVAVVRINESTNRKLPQTAQRQVFRVKSDGLQVPAAV